MIYALCIMAAFAIFCLGFAIGHKNAPLTIMYCFTREAKVLFFSGILAEDFERDDYGKRRGDYKLPFLAPKGDKPTDKGS